MHWRGADAAIADDDGGDSLGQLRQHLWGTDYICVVMGMGIDKAWRQHISAAIHHLRCRVAGELADCANAVALDGDVNSEVEGLRLAAATVEYARISDESIADWHGNSLKIYATRLSVP